MGGKGRRRREKNYLAAHGGNTRLPPPPKLSDLNAVPAKLRKIMELKNGSPTQDFNRKTQSGKTERDAGTDLKKTLKLQKVNQLEFGSAPEHSNQSGEITITEAERKRSRKRKREPVKDLRFQEMDNRLSGTGSKRRERRKQYLQEKKKKHKRPKKDDSMDFPGHEEIKFGEVVEAPPKLTFRKVINSFQDASHERLRLEAVEAYRNRKAWASRIGAALPQTG